jgi:hypothetical protein
LIFKKFILPPRNSNYDKRNPSIIIQKNVTFIIGRVTVVQLPTAETVKNDQMIYSENMPRLLKMQKDAVGAMIKLSPSQFRSVENRVRLATLLLVKKF